jgi:ATP-binding cassette subfamily B protein
MIKIFSYFKNYKLPLLIVLSLTVVQAFSQLYLPDLMSDMINTGLINQDIDYVYEIGSRMLVFAGISGIAVILARFFASRMSLAITRDIRRDIFTKVEGYSLNEFDKIGTASLITRNTNDVTQIQNMLVMLTTMVLLAPIMAIGGIYMAIQTDATLSWLIVAIVAVMGIAIGVIAVNAVPLFKVIQKKLDRINLVLREGITGIRVIRAFNKQEYEEQRFSEANDDLTDTAIKAYKIMGLVFPVLMFIMNISSVLIVWFGALRIDTGGMDIGSLMAFQQYVMTILFGVMMGTIMFVLIPRASASADRINEILEMEASIADTDTPIAIEDVHGCLQFKDVGFKYSTAEEPAVCHISFDAHPGETTAIIGGTGSGKSTISNLIPRFYEATEGEIIIDGVNVNAITQKELREKIGYVPQKVNLFEGTIADNVRFGKKNATEEEIIHALKVAQAYEFVSELPEGIEAHVSQGGKNFSGGQKQRLSIARALVRQPEVYIFDDSFSALDFKTDARLRQDLSREVKKATVIIVAQRVSTVMNADRIIVLDKGNVVGQGTHSELLESCVVYGEIVASQLSKEEIA